MPLAHGPTRGGATEPLGGAGGLGGRSGTGVDGPAVVGAGTDAAGGGAGRAGARFVPKELSCPGDGAATVPPPITSGGTLFVPGNTGIILFEASELSAGGALVPTPFVRIEKMFDPNLFVKIPLTLVPSRLVRKFPIAGRFVSNRRVKGELVITVTCPSVDCAWLCTLRHVHGTSAAVRNPT